MKRFKRIFLALLLSIQCAVFAGSLHYNFLCGNDEDGCKPSKIGDNHPNYTCNCVEDVSNADVCLDLHKGKCVPIDYKTGHCSASATLYPDRIACLTVLWQSTYSKTDPSKNCVALSVKPVAHICSVECSDLYDCQKAPMQLRV